MRKSIFTKEQEEFLLSNIGKLPPQVLINKFIGCYPEFTKKQVQHRVTRLVKKHDLKTSVVKCTDTITMRYLASILNVSLDRVTFWRRKGLNVETVNENDDPRFNRYYVNKSDIEEFFIKNPKFTWGIQLSRIRKISKSKQLIKAISPYVDQPTPRQISIIRLDNGDVFHTAVDAAKSLNCEVTSKGILYNCSTDKPMINGTNWYKLSYAPVNVPVDIHSEFLYYAGKIFYEIFDEMHHLSGCVKSSLIIAAKNAIQITIWVFKKNAIQLIQDKLITPKDELAEFYKEMICHRIRYFYGMTENDSYTSIKKKITNKIIYLFVRYYGDYNSAYNKCDDFVSCFIANNSNRILKNKLLPSGYQPRTQLERADFFAFLFGSCYSSKIETITGKVISIVWLYAIKWIEKNKLSTSYRDDYIKHQNVSHINMGNYDDKVELIIEYVKSQNLDDELEFTCIDFIRKYLEFDDIERVFELLQIDNDMKMRVLDVLKLR